MIIQNACAIMLVALMCLGATAADTQQTPPPPLTEAGQKLEAGYAAQLQSLKAEIVKALPQIDEQKKVAYSEARKAETVAVAAFNAAKQQLNNVGKAQGAVGHAKGKWIGGAETGIAAAEAALKKATTDAEREAAQKDLANSQKNKEDGLKALKEREEQLAALKREEPKWIQERDAAEKVINETKARTMQAVDAFDLAAVLSSDKLDSLLAKFVVLFEATPQGLARFAQQGAEQVALVDQVLGDDKLMKRMVQADGANGGNYGRAMEIYRAIWKASSNARDGVLERLALAIALEHAVPITQRNPTGQTQATGTVDPVKRYLAYEKAYVDGELDSAFKDLSVWELRFVVDGDEPDETSAWGREMLRNYRPDIIFDPGYAWRYVKVVTTDVKYGRYDAKLDRPELQQHQNSILNGGVCGHRAFFGRFILRAFGIPNTARPQPRHAALVHWTPAGWVPCLGGPWGSGSTKTRYNGDQDFLATTQARAAGEAFLQVKRAQWIGDVVGEDRVFGFSRGEPGRWYGASLYWQKKVIEGAKAQTLAAVGTHLGEANESAETKAAAVVKAAVTDADKKVAVGTNGVITIPAAACGGMQPVKSFLGGLQAFCGDSFTCEVEVPTPSKYRLTVRVVTVGDSGKIQLTANNVKDAVDIAIPYTCGKWEQTPPVEVTLVQGKNTLAFSKPERGFTLKDITLTPVK